MSADCTPAPRPKAPTLWNRAPYGSWNTLRLACQPPAHTRLTQANTGGRKFTARALPPRIRKCYDMGQSILEASYGQHITAQQPREAQAEEREAEARTEHFDLLRHGHQECGWQEG